MRKWTSEDIEAAAKAIFAHWQFASPVAWVDEGNSLMQGKARDFARVALATLDQPLLDWLSGGIDRSISRTIGGEWCAQDDVIGAWYGSTPREALTNAMEATKP